MAAFLITNAIFSGAVVVLEPSVADESIGRAQWGWVLVAQASGVLTVTALVTQAPRSYPLWSALPAGLTAPLIAVLGVAPLPPILLGAALLAGAGTGYFETIWQTSLQSTIAEEHLARVYSFDALGSLLARPIGQIFIGPVVGAIGRTPTLVGSAILILITSSSAAIFSPIRLLPTVQPTTASPGEHPPGGTDGDDVAFDPRRHPDDPARAGTAPSAGHAAADRCGVPTWRVTGESMDYIGDLATVQQDLARSHDMDRRRSQVLAALSPIPGEQIIEIGCGGGLLLRELARAIAPNGRALGIDLSGDQVDAAARACADIPNARAELGSAMELAAKDGCFDASVSTQVLEYIEDVHVAVAELARVTRNGGRFLNVATNWDSLFIAGGEADLTERIVGAWDRHAPHPNLPVALPGLLRGAGFTSVVQTALPLVNRAFNRSTWGFGIARLMAAFASSVEDLDGDASSRWLSSLDDAAAHNGLFMSVMPMMTTATRSASDHVS